MLQKILKILFLLKIFSKTVDSFLVRLVLDFEQIACWRHSTR